MELWVRLAAWEKVCGRLGLGSAAQSIQTLTFCQNDSAESAKSKKEGAQRFVVAASLREAWACAPKGESRYRGLLAARSYSYNRENSSVAGVSPRFWIDPSF